MSETLSDQSTGPHAASNQRLTEVCRGFEAAWENGPPRIEDFVANAGVDELALLLVHLVEIDIRLRRRHGDCPRAEDYRQRFPTLDAQWLAGALAVGQGPASASTRSLPVALPGGTATVPALGPRHGICCPNCGQPVSPVVNSADPLVCRGCGSSFRVENVHQPTTLEEVRQLGRFQLLDRVGEGSFGTVWRARDMDLGRIVALKIPHPSVVSSAAAAERCQREARSAAQLRHPNIVRLYDVTTLAGVPVLVSDFIDGVPLKDLLEVKRLTFREAAALVAEMADALDYAHAQGLIHRDVKPGNIMVETVSDRAQEGPAGRPILVDFGLALREEAEIVMTLEGQVLGTPAYMSPEQAAGHGHRVDRRSDVYSLGVVLYELLCGERPFRGSRAMLLHQVQYEEPRPPRRVNDKVPRDLETICLKTMAKEPRRRYGTAGDLAADLRRFLRGEPIEARPTGRAERLWRWCRRNPTVAALVAAVFFSLTAGTTAALYWAIRASRGERDALEQAEHRRAAWLRSERQRYAAEINLAQQAWETAQPLQMRTLLAGLARQGEGPDQRGFEWYWLDRLRQEELYTLGGHTEQVRALAMSPDGRWLVSASGKTIKLWEVSTGREQRALEGHRFPVFDLAFSPDGRWLASAGNLFQGFLPGEVKVWDLNTRQAARALAGHTGPIQGLAFSRDSSRLAGVGGGLNPNGPARVGELNVWAMPTGKQVLKETLNSASMVGVVFSPDGQHLATAGADMNVQVWDATVRRPPLFTLSGHTGPVLTVVYSPDGSRIASASWDRTIRTWDAKTGKPLGEVGRHEGPVFGIAFCPNGQRLVSASADRTVVLWDVANRLRIGTLRGHSDTVFRVVCSPDDSRLASSSADRTVKVWSAASALPSFSGEAPSLAVYCIAFSPDSRTVAAAGPDRAIRLWDVELGLPVLVLRGHSDSVDGVAFSKDGRRLASASLDHLVKIWDSGTGKTLHTLRGHPGPVSAVAFSPNGRWLASAGATGQIRIWAADSGRHLRTLEGHEDSVTALAFSPDNRLASAGMDGTVRIWDLASNNDSVTLGKHSDRVRCLAFSEDGRHLASGGADAVIKRWDAITGQELPEIGRGRGQVLGLAFTRLGRLASANSDRTIKIWDTSTAQQLVALAGYEDQVRSVAFSPDGELLASGSLGQGLKVWDARSLTADQNVHREALGLLRALCDLQLPLPTLQARIRGDRTSREEVRQRALGLVERYWQGLVRLDADRVIRAAPRTLPRPDLLIEIRRKPGLTEAVREEALAQAGHYVEHAETQHSSSRLVVLRPDRSFSLYQRAVRQAQAACRLSPQNRAYLITLGMAHYRVKDYQEALDTLLHARRFHSDTSDTSPPAFLAFLAMTQHQLGQAKAAQATLARLREAMREPRWATHSEAKALFHEAEALIDPRPADGGN
jgi:WD40 repeat protein